MTPVATVGIPLNDIDFLASPSFATLSFIYRYRSGVLKAKVQAVLQALAGENGRMPVSASPDQFRISQAGEGFLQPSSSQIGSILNLPRTSICSRS